MIVDHFFPFFIAFLKSIFVAKVQEFYDNQIHVDIYDRQFSSKYHKLFLQYLYEHEDLQQLAF